MSNVKEILCAFLSVYMCVNVFKARLVINLAFFYSIFLSESLIYEVF